ncbi:MAG: ketoacyl-ACP synthase III [Chloroflexi bacterium]|nr:ketoacyl-ACP synthase III [Chloroflexota bacterium]
MALRARITGWGKYLPQRILTNRELEKWVDTSDAWIRSRTGIRERRIAADDETASTMAVEASRQALEVAHLNPKELDLIIAATVTPDKVFPACASLIQHQLGASKAAAFDLNAACSGFVYALATANQFIGAGGFEKVLVVGTDVYSRILDWRDRSTCVLFGDGAGAVIMEASTQGGSLSFVLGSDGSGADLLYVPGLCDSTLVANDHHYLTMNGPEVFKFAIHTMVGATKQVVETAHLTLDDIDLFIYHQANSRIIQAAAKSLSLPPHKVFINVDRYGNTSAASIPIALCEAIEEGRIQKGDHLALVGFGGGLSWGAMVVEWDSDPLEKNV